MPSARDRYARLLRGTGLEIGALRSPMRLPNASRVLYSDILTPAQLDAVYPGSVHPDIVSDSESFPGVADASFDFVVACHVLEHVTDPIGTLREWHRLLKPGGLLLLAVPDGRHTFDRTRPRTTLAHLQDDHASTLPPRERNRAHLLEWAEHVEGLQPGSPGFVDWVSRQLVGGYSVHNHVWVAQDLLRLVRHVGDAHRAVFALNRWSNTAPTGNEVVALLQARAAPLDRRGQLRWALAMLGAAAQDPLQRSLAGAKHVRRRLRARSRG